MRSATLLVAISISDFSHKSFGYETKELAIAYLLSLYPALTETDFCFFVLNQELLIDLFISSSRRILLPNLLT